MYGEELQGEWGPPPEGGILPVDERDFINQIRTNCRRDLPVLKKAPEHDKIMVMVCGGPSAKLFLEDIRKKRQDDRYRIFCSNKTHDWLIENEIIPHYQFMIDPKEGKWKDVRKPHKDVKYLIGLCSHPKVFDALKGYDVTMVASLSGAHIDGISDSMIMSAFFDKNDYAILEGGSMAGLRAMNLAHVLGYLKVEFYGFDSCFFDYNENKEPIFYSYYKERGENIIECKCEDGKVYESTPVFASQARQFIKWKHRLAWIDFVIHGDSLTQHIDMLDTEEKKPKHDLLITEYMLKMNRKMFRKEMKGKEDEKHKEFGVSGHEYSGKIAVLAGQMVRKFNELTVLDYGCGQGTFGILFPPITGVTLIQYDPCVEKFEKRPDPADLVVCTDVLEHIEPGCLENVLNDLQKLTKKTIFLVICLSAASKKYPDGQNCHLSLLPFDVWFAKIKKRFNIMEFKLTKNMQGHDVFICVAQAKEIE